MNNSVESLLEDDHESLGELLTELDLELAKPNFARGFELLDLFWARLAVHIRAENLHLFPALANVPASHFTGKGSLPTSEEAHSLLLRLRLDHDFFMKQLAQIMKAARENASHTLASRDEISELRQRMTGIGKRLETHNRLEEKLAYSWPALLFDEPRVARLCGSLQHELENLPPRFAEG
jgi:hypothetical protein